MRDLARGIVIGLVLLAVAGAIAARAGWATFEPPRAAGQGAWYVARASGFAAFAALALDAISGLLVSTRDRRFSRAALVDLHGWLSPLAIALVLGHAMVLLADGYVRFDAIDVAVPFAASWRPAAVGLGTLAAYLAIVVHASFALRKHLGTTLWRRLHALSFAAFVLAALHGIFAGSDTPRPWAIAIYAAPLAIVGGLVARRIRATRARGAAKPA